VWRLASKLISFLANFCFTCTSLLLSRVASFNYGSRKDKGLDIEGS
jgi:hypothetical protein